MQTTIEVKLLSDEIEDIKFALGEIIRQCDETTKEEDLPPIRKHALTGQANRFGRLVNKLNRY